MNLILKDIKVFIFDFDDVLTINLAHKGHQSFFHLFLYKISLISHWGLKPGTI